MFGVLKYLYICNNSTNRSASERRNYKKSEFHKLSQTRLFPTLAEQSNQSEIAVCGNRVSVQRYSRFIQNEKNMSEVLKVAVLVKVLALCNPTSNDQQAREINQYQADMGLPNLTLGSQKMFSLLKYENINISTRALNALAGIKGGYI